jgi:hypothetical protein
MVGECRDILGLKHRPPSLSASMFVRQCCDDTAAYLKRAPLDPPRGLRRLMADLVVYEEFDDARKALDDVCRHIANDIVSCQFQKSSLTSLLDAGLERLGFELGPWLDPDTMVGDLATHMQYQLFKWNEAEQECDTLHKTFTFLEIRGMSADPVAAAELTSQGEKKLFLTELEALNDSINLELAARNHLSDESTRALKFFCARKSTIFAKLFDTVRKEPGAASWGPNAVTAETLRRLGVLVNANNARISDLHLDLQGMVRQLDTRTGQQQKQELCMIGEYFHHDSTVHVQ